MLFTDTENISNIFCLKNVSDLMHLKIENVKQVTLKKAYVTITCLEQVFSFSHSQESTKPYIQCTGLIMKNCKYRTFIYM